MRIEEVNKELHAMKEYARNNNVPIMQDEGIDFVKNFIEKKNITNILEIGTAIGYSAIIMCLVNKDVIVTTIERDETRYMEALKNIKKFGLEKRINLIFNDALNVEFEEKFEPGVVRDMYNYKDPDNIPDPLSAPGRAAGR